MVTLPLFEWARRYVREASHSGQALEMIAKERPDLVLSDVMMPVLNGPELCWRLKVREDTKNIPVILMTSAGRRATDGAGADAFIGKPFELDVMEKLAKHWLPVRAP